MNPRILVITPVHHIDGVPEILETAGEVIYRDDPTEVEVKELISDVHAIFTNPNKSDVAISSEIIDAAKNLEVICTASTGTNHIDTEYAKRNNVDVISLKNEREVINEISSTAENAFGLMMCGIRQIPQAWESVKQGYWDYQPFLGRQLDFLTIGVIGYGRLGSLFADYCLAFDCDVMVYDPYKDVEEKEIEQVEEVETLLEHSNVISLHTHLTDETRGMVNSTWFDKIKEDVVIVNTSRGEIVNERELITFLKNHPDAYYATDVLSGEIEDVEDNEFRNWAITEGTDQTVITPHIGTTDGQRIAFRHAANLLVDNLSEK